MWQTTRNWFSIWHQTSQNILIILLLGLRELFIWREGSFLTYTRNSEQHQNIAGIKSTLKIPPRHNGATPIKIKGHNLRDHVAYFISNQHTNKGLDPNIHVHWWYLWYQRQIYTIHPCCKLHQQTCHLQPRTMHRSYGAIHQQHATNIC